jgi:hypothetical protein
MGGRVGAMNKECATRINDVLVQCYKDLHSSIDTARSSCSDAEHHAYCRRIGAILGYMLIDLLDPMYKEHPDIAPDFLRQSKD